MFGLFLSEFKIRRDKLCLWYYAEEHSNIYLKHLIISTQQTNILVGSFSHIQQG